MYTEDIQTKTAVIKIESIVDSIRKHIEESIFKGDLKPGERIKEQEIASFLGISRPPLREALKVLEADGLVTRRPNRGTYVSLVTEKDAWEIYTLKSELYDLATRLAFDRITDSHIRTWEEVISEMEECLKGSPPDVMRYQGLNQRFHNIMIEIAGHERLGKIIQVLHNQVKRFSCLSLSESERHLRESFDYHKEILAALKNRDMRLASRLTKEHILQGLQIVERIISREVSSLSLKA